MIESIYEIGNSIIGNNISWKEQTVNPVPRGDMKVIFLDLEYDEKKQEFVSHEIDIEEFDSSNYVKYLYRKMNGSSSNLSLCTLVKKDESFLPYKKGNDMKEGLWKNRIISFFGKQVFDENNLLSKLITYLKAHESEDGSILLADECEEKLNEVRTKEEHTFFFSLKVNGRYLGESEEENDFILEFQRRLQIKAAKSSNKDGNTQQCFCCLTQQSVKGNSDVFKFYTIDKLSYIRGGSKKEAYLNYPICEDCDTKLKVGREWVEKNASFKIFDMNLWFIPKPLFPLSEDDFESVKNIIEIWKKRYTEKTRMNEGEKNLLERSREIFDELSKETKIPIVFDMLFWLKGQMAEERILLHLQNVNEFRVHALYEKKQEIDKFIQKEIELENLDFPYSFELYKLQQFFDKEGRDRAKRPIPSQSKDLLHVLSDCFTDRDFNPDTLIPIYMKKLKSEMHKKDSGKKKDESPRIDFKKMVEKSTLMKDIMASHLFFTSLLHTITNGESDENMTQDCFTDWFKDKKLIAQSELQQGLILLGVLVQNILDVQQQVRGSKPFFTQLKNFQMKRSDVDELYPKIFTKLTQYRAWYPSTEIIGTAISKRLLNNDEQWNMSNEKMNMFIAFGMSLKQTLNQLAYDQFQNNKKKSEVV